MEVLWAPNAFTIETTLQQDLCVATGEDEPLELRLEPLPSHISYVAVVVVVVVFRYLWFVVWPVAHMSHVCFISRR
jgi:hypothetical protein